MTATLDRDAAGAAGDEAGSEWERPRHPRRAWLRRHVLRPLVIVPIVLVVAAATWWAVHSSSSSSAQTGPVQRVVAVTAGTIEPWGLTNMSPAMLVGSPTESLLDLPRTLRAMPLEE